MRGGVWSYYTALVKVVRVQRREASDNSGELYSNLPD